MASPLDLGLLEGFSVIFSMILVFVLIYGVLSKGKVFGENHGLHALIGFASAIMLLFAPKVNKVIITMVPWFVLFFIFLMLLLQFWSWMGVKESDLRAKIMDERSISTWFVIIGFIIFLGTLGSVYFSEDDPGNSATFSPDGEGFETSGAIGETGESAFFATLFHPKVLGVIVVLLIGTFTIMMMSSGAAIKQ